MSDLDRTLLQQILVGEDLEIHVSIVSSAGSPPFIEIRNYVPSSDYYGRGMILPPGTPKLIAAALNSALRQGLAS